MSQAIKQFFKAVQAADPTFHGWRVVEDTLGVDPFLLCEWVKDGAGRSGPIYQFDAGSQTAWGYRSSTHRGFLVADTVEDTPTLYTGPMDDITVTVVARLVGDDLRDWTGWLFDVRGQTISSAFGPALWVTEPARQ